MRCLLFGLFEAAVFRTLVVFLVNLRSGRRFDGAQGDANASNPRARGTARGTP
jgi:hypothetical protein